MPKKTSPRKKLIKKLDSLLALYIRQRDQNVCQKCGKHSRDNRAMHVSHVIPRSRGYRTRWETLNAMILCFKCHIGWWHKHPIESGDWFKKKFPDRYKYLSSLPSDPVKFADADLEEIAISLEALCCE